MVKTYKLSLEAKQDLKNIYAYGYQRWGEAQADIYFATFFESFLKNLTTTRSLPES